MNGNRWIYTTYNYSWNYPCISKIKKLAKESGGGIEGAIGIAPPNFPDSFSISKNKQELMWTCDKLQWTDKHIQALKLEKIVYNQDFHLFFCKIGLILHNFALRSGNYWLSSGLEQLVLSEYAISSISNQPKSKKSTKTSFSKFVEKWLSLEAWWPTVKGKK